MAWYDALIGGVGSFITGGTEALMKARSGPDLAPANTPIPPQPPGPDAELQSLLYDPFALLETLGYREKASPITYDTLKRMAIKVPVMPGILQTRLNQVARFNKPQRDDTKSGFEFVLRDPDEKATKQDRIRMRELSQWMVSCGSTKTLSRDTFGTFLRKFTGDSLVLDQGAFEIIENNIGVPADFYAVDGGSFRIADTAWDGRPDQEDDQIRYVQVHDESVIAELTPKQLCFAVRNPRTDLRVNGYGWSEMEMCAHIITSMLNGYTYNSKYFSQGSSAKGMWNLPDISDAKVRIFARQWHMITSGILNVWRTPVTNFKDAQWIDLHKSNRDMEFGEWMNFNIKLYTATYCIDPAEIHFTYGNAGQTQQLFQSPEAQKLKASKDKGLIPLMEFIAECINKWLIWRIDERFEFRFTGLDPKDGEKSIDLEKKKVTYLMTVNELRKENDLPALDPELGDVILDSTWMQNKSALDAAQQQEEMMAQQEMEGEAPAEEEPAPNEVEKGGWEGLLGEAMSKAVENVRLVENRDEPMKKSLPSKTAQVKETCHGETVEYEIDF